MPTKAPALIKDSTPRPQGHSTHEQALTSALLSQGGYEVELRPDWAATTDGQALTAALILSGTFGPAKSTHLKHVPSSAPPFAAVQAALDLPRRGGAAQDEAFAGYALNGAGVWVAHAWLKSWSGTLTEFGPAAARYFGVALATVTDHDIARQQALLRASAASGAAWESAARSHG